MYIDNIMYKLSYEELLELVQIFKNDPKISSFLKISR